MAITSGVTTQVLLTGLSTDTKPLGPSLQNATFLETDTAKTYQYLGGAWVVSNPRAQLADINGNSPVFVPSALGYLTPTTPDPDCVLADSFNGTTIDTINRWQTPVTAGTGTMTQAGGSLVATLSTTANNAAAITSIENFEPAIAAMLSGGLLTIEASPTTNTNRCMGFYTRPGSFTAATPVQDGYVWEYDITGTFGASIYNAGTRVSRTIFALAGATLLPVAVSFQGLNANFYYGSFTTPVLTVPIIQASTFNLPFGFHAINHTSGPAGAPTWTLTAMAVIDQSGTSTNVFNGQTIQRLRSPSIFINLNAVSIAAEATIWTPASGRKFRLMGYVLTSAGAVGASNVLLKDNTGGTTRLIVPFSAAAATIASPPMGNGILSAAANNVLTATGGAAETLSGYLFGCEE